MSALTDRPLPLRPRARGWIHLYSAVGAVAMGVALVVLAATTVSATAAVACAIYAVTLVGLFGISSTYHLHTWISPRARTWMKRADHSMIFVFIAGTYTPIAVLAMDDPSRTVVLVVVWAGAAGGVALKMLRPHAPRWVGVPFYLALGWVAVFLMPDMLSGGGVAVVVLICVGGLLYSVGAVFYAIRRPNPWPGTFGYHECFHAMVTGAAICHAVAIWLLLYSSAS
ncbi:hemolysin III family protein [Nakamurella flavida]|uniref:Hemolysin III family protein n=1 Tax=Nakamurella flavida TaxID=363630 RepID=A0A938YJ20_9ACTN|nr:hemolysin III family protein [Nakamurella flavida]MBM9476887.1 hemolysin III family protein [Nakamurella flavida]MDP9779831.1 hemolysin III [Nakamurella flavida]